MYDEKINSKIKLSNNSSFVILIFVILKFRNIGRSTFRRYKFWPTHVPYTTHKTKIFFFQLKYDSCLSKSYQKFHDSGRYPALGRRFLNQEKINIFRLMHNCFIFKTDLLNPNFIKKKIHILYCFSWKVTFSMSKVNFWIFGFIETKRLNIDLFTNENWNKFKCHRSKVSRRKKKFVVNKVL